MCTPTTRALLDADADVFLHQSLSTPVLRCARRVRRDMAHGRRRPAHHGLSRQQRASGGLPAPSRDGRGACASSTRCRSRRAASPTLRQWRLHSASLRLRRIRSARCCSRRAVRSRSAWRSSSRGLRRDATRRSRSGTPFTARRSTRFRSAAKPYSARAWGRSCPAPSTRRRATRPPAGSAALAPATRAAPSTSTTCSGKEEDIGAVVIETIRSTDVADPAARVLPDRPRRLRPPRRAADPGRNSDLPRAHGPDVRVRALRIVPDMVVLGKGLGGAVVPDGGADRAARPRHRRAIGRSAITPTKKARSAAPPRSRPST